MGCLLGEVELGGGVGGGEGPLLGDAVGGCVGGDVGCLLGDADGSLVGEAVGHDLVQRDVWRQAHPDPARAIRHLGRRDRQIQHACRSRSIHLPGGR